MYLGDYIKMIVRFAIFVLTLTLSDCVLLADIVLNFGTAAFSQDLPYSADGFTFASQQGNSRVLGFSFNTDRYLNLVGDSLGSNVTVRLTATTPFDFHSVDIEGFGPSRDWTFLASSGSTLNIPGGSPAGTIDFTSLAGWTNLTFVDVIHDDAAANANLRLDNFDVSVSAVPEPSSIVLVGASLLAAGYQRRRLCQKWECANKPMRLSGGSAAS
jgi:hypothetical protein